MYVNHAINFYLYCLTGDMWRNWTSSMCSVLGRLLTSNDRNAYRIPLCLTVVSVESRHSCRLHTCTTCTSTCTVSPVAVSDESSASCLAAGLRQTTAVVSLREQKTGAVRVDLLDATTAKTWNSSTSLIIDVMHHLLISQVTAFRCDDS